ncbi:hypothetical protein DZG00_04580 [Clavibacter lycopersici]|uniref:Uncharacterized protein n=1 Tax=Clavibacter lycopersici TaxID=2301718 RepID=A0A399TET5_9MICO|nr:hypothetical protein DZG00_04580 [Clavibacter lycopersici]RIJ62354.1 hypothetical protein DZG02_02180 [Clavibacter lycopersici]
MSDYELLMRGLIREELRDQLPLLLTEALAADRATVADEKPASVSESASAVLTVDKVAALSRRHPDTVRLALAVGALDGHRHHPRGKWILEWPCAEIWMLAEPCVHKRTVSPLRPSRR